VCFGQISLGVIKFNLYIDSSPIKLSDISERVWKFRRNVISLMDVGVATSIWTVK
jgi:hypothetical protein